MREGAGRGAACSGVPRDESPASAEEVAVTEQAQQSEQARWLQRALDLAERGRHTVSPNPLVGCVLVRDGEVVGQGWHQRAGGPHAEIVALRGAGDAAVGATAYVTLEPCDHTGRTGPCTRALTEAGVARVVYALPDPDPLAAGGAATLRAAGLVVDQGPLGAAAARQNEVFLHGLAHRRPFVVAKAAVSLDGRIAAADGTSQWLTGEAARRRAHQLRAEVDAVVVGSGTVLADNPRLTVRLADYAGPQPLRVVLDIRGRTPATARVHDDAAPTLVWRDGRDLDRLLAALWDREVRSVLVEGGGTVLDSFVRAALVDKLAVHVAPALLGAGAKALLPGGWVTTLAQAPRLRLDRVEQVGDDALLTLYPPAPELAEV